MVRFRIIIVFIFLILYTGRIAMGQVVINEGSNRNYTSIADENGDYPDWIEIYNSGNADVNIHNYSLTDDFAEPAKWKFPNLVLKPHQFKTVFCSGKDRSPVTGFTIVENTGPFTPVTGWNIHAFSTPFYWDGVSDILINTCSYSSLGYTSNSVFKQVETSFWSSSFSVMDGSPAACSWQYGYRSHLRPVMKFNGQNVGAGTTQNQPTDYPAPYGNWYWSARHQMLVLASELSAAGLNAGYISSLGFLVVYTDPGTQYDYFEIAMKLVDYSDVPAEFDPVDPTNALHTNFKIANEGETVSLCSPSGGLLSQLLVECGDLDNSNGSKPDGSPGSFLFGTATPGKTNDGSETYPGYLLPPVFSVPAGFYDSPVTVTITNPNPGPTTIHYTIDGDEPSPTAIPYTGTPIPVNSTTVIKARVFSSTFLPSPNAVATYFIGVEHSTPVISLTTNNQNLYGSRGIFDNWWMDWKKAAHIEYFDSQKNSVFSQRAGIHIDGGWGGARAHPQHSMRVRLADGTLGDGPVDYPIIPDRPARLKYSQVFLRNGSNQFLAFPYKDACEQRIMSTLTGNHYSSWRPVTVYLNGGYFGLYELREKFDAEYFETLEGADPGEVDLLTMTAWNNYVLHAVEGSIEPFYEAVNAFLLLDPKDTTYWDSADAYFDMASYTDYIIGESWISNTDWPWNNIKLYRSDKSGYRWRFCLTDLELALQPNGWTDFYFDSFNYMMSFDTTNVFIYIWQKSMRNDRFRNYFYNRYADVMNSGYLSENMLAIESDMYARTVTEMENEYARWGDPNNIPGQMDDFLENHRLFQSQLEQRTQVVRDQIQNDFLLPNQVNVTLEVDPPGAGTIRISTLEPESYPWQGVYFNGIPVRIEAVAADGNNFDHWSGNGLIADTLNAVFLDTLNASDIAFTAHFHPWAVQVTGSGPVAEFTVYPNPAEEILYVRKEGNSKSISSYKILNVNGITVLEGTLPVSGKSTSINISAIPNGVYILCITSGEGVRTTARFVRLN